jgi:hypothetical protein
VGCVGPAAVEKGAVERVALAGGKYATAIVGVNRGLGCAEEPRADPRSCGAERKDGGETASVGDAASGDDRNRVHRVDDPRDERER